MTKGSACRLHPDYGPGGRQAELRISAHGHQGHQTGRSFWWVVPIDAGLWDWVVSISMRNLKFENEHRRECSQQGELEQDEFQVLSFHIAFPFLVRRQGKSLMLIPSCMDFEGRQSRVPLLDYAV